jgi:ACS family D-galactonate transporter-like MFS transporter
MVRAMTSDASPPMTHVRWQVIVLVMALCFISHFNRSSMSVAGTDQIMQQYQIDPVQMGGVYSAFLLIYSICMIPGGILIDRFGPRRALMVVGFGSALFAALTGVLGWAGLNGASLLMGLILVRGTMGFLSAPLHPAGARAVGNWFPAGQRSWANGIVTAAAIAGVAASYPGFGALIARVGWPAGFVIGAGITAVLTTIWALVARDTPAVHPRVNEAERSWIQMGELNSVSNPEGQAVGWKDLLCNRSLMLVTLSYAAVGYFQYLFVYWMQYYFDKVLNLGGTTSKYYAGFLQVALAVGMPLGGWLSAHWSRKWGVRRGRAFVAGGGMAVSAMLLGLGVLCSEPVWIVVWFALAHAALGASEGPIWATAVDIGVSKGGTAAAICNTGGNLGGLIAPVMTPWISGMLGWSWGIALGGVICLMGAFCWLGIHPHGEVRRRS